MHVRLSGMLIYSGAPFVTKLQMASPDMLSHKVCRNDMKQSIQTCSYGMLDAGFSPKIVCTCKPE